MVNKLTVWLMLLMIAGCKSTNIVMGYYYSDTKSLSNHTLFLEENGSFKYNLRGDLIDAQSNGTWRLSGSKELILASNDSLRSGIVESVEKTGIVRQGFSINLTDAGGEPLAYASVTVNDEHNGFNVNSDGYGSYQIDSLKSLTIHFLGEDYQYLLEDPSTNVLTLAIKLHSNETIFFNNKAWKLQGKKLIGKNGLTLKRSTKK